MSSPTLTRRALLAGTGTAIASAALVVPYVNAVRAGIVVEHPGDRVVRLCNELSAALNDCFGDQFEAVVGIKGAIRLRDATPSQQVRLNTARTLIDGVMSERGSTSYTAVIREPKANIAFVLDYDANGTLSRQIDIA